MKETVRSYLSNHADLRCQYSHHNDDSCLELTIGSKKKILWICAQGHEYEMSPYDKISRKLRCNVCYGSTVFPGVNDLSTTHPDIAREWSPANDKLASEVKFSSSYVAEWICSKDSSHVFSSAVADRTRTDNQQRSCARCAREKRAHDAREKSRARTDTIMCGDAPPDMVRFFVSSLSNTDVNPTSTSRTLCTWKCDKGHTWVCAPYKFNGCPSCTRHENSIVHTEPSVALLWNDEKDIRDVSCGSAYVASFICQKGHTWKAPVYSVTASQRKGFSGCPVCSGSHKQHELSQYILDILSDSHCNVINNTRSIIAPYELDIYVPEKNIAIEFNGVYWHGDAALEHRGVDGRSYHAMKQKMCQDKGIFLLTIWEDDWDTRKGIVKSMIARKLGVSSQKKIGARKCYVGKINSKKCNDFLDTYHIQGAHPGTHYYGLYSRDDDSLVAASVWLKRGEHVVLERYATSCIVQGGFTKLMSHFITMHTGVYNSIITFADLCVSDGKLYTRNGFVEDKKIPPDYRYVVQKNRVHKFNYRKSRFKRDANLIYREGLTESELAQLNGLDKVWDCGKVRYVYPLQ